MNDYLYALDKDNFFQGVMSCSLMYNYQHFIGTCSFHLHEDRNCRLFQYVDEHLSDYMTGEVIHRH
jgi:hypothetical protein